MDLADAIRNAHDGRGLGERAIMADGGVGQGRRVVCPLHPPLAGRLPSSDRFEISVKSWNLKGPTAEMAN
jgi:hypothetical protein